MSFPKPSILGCAAVQWMSGPALALRIFHVSLAGELVMCTYDNPDMNRRNDASFNPVWQYTIPKIDGQPIRIPVTYKNGITAVSVHPNTERHEIHVFFSTGELVQSAILNVRQQVWFMDSLLPTLKIGDCPSAAIGWENGTQNEFRLYLVNSVWKPSPKNDNDPSKVTTFHTASIREVIYSNGSWYMGNNNEPIEEEDYEIPKFEGSNGWPKLANPRVAACTWLDNSNQRQIRVYYIHEYSRSSQMPAQVGLVAPAPGVFVIVRGIRELIYKNDQNYWMTSGMYSGGFGGDRSNPLVALPIKSSNGIGIRQYGYRSADHVDKDDGITFNELSWDTSSDKWKDARLPFDLLDLERGSWDNPGVSVPFSGVAWNWPDPSQVSIRLYRVAFKNQNKTQGYIVETGFDTRDGKWTRTMAKIQ